MRGNLVNWFKKQTQIMLVVGYYFEVSEKFLGATVAKVTETCKVTALVCLKVKMIARFWGHRI